MNFRRAMRREEPEINLIPLIDLLLVILIFLLISTRYATPGDVRLTLPTADARAPAADARQIVVSVTREGDYLIDGRRQAFGSAEQFGAALRRVQHGDRDVPVLIRADAATTHQAVVSVLEAARLAGIARIGFATRPPTDRTP